jgi:hypothetical protein
MKDKDNSNDNLLPPLRACLSLASIGGMSWTPSALDHSAAPPRLWRPTDKHDMKLSEVSNRILPPPALPPAVPQQWGRSFLGEDWGE